MIQRDKQILQIALPSILSNITVPLLGLIDVAIVGHLGAPAYIGAIAVGGLMFNIIYWIFGFLRMGTSGMTSQAFGQRDLPEVMRLLLRATGIGLTIAIGLIVMQSPIRQAVFLLVHPTDEVSRLATTYFHICIWGAPAILMLYGLTGWYIGMQNSRIPMIVAIVQNLVNIAASLFFVYICHMKVEGVAFGTLIAQYAGLITAIWVGRLRYQKLGKYLTLKGVWRKAALIRFFQVNRDIFLRTLCLVAVTLFFTSAGAAQGEIVLAVNTLLMQLFTLYSYIMDGFANAGEALSGRYLGARNKASFTDSIHRLFLWGSGMALLFTTLYAIGGESFLHLLTDDRNVTATANTYFYWALAIPICGMAAFIWDGIYIGATATRGMLISMAVAVIIFFLLYYGLVASLGNHALWLAFICYLGVRGAVQTLLASKLYKQFDA